MLIKWYMSLVAVGNYLRPWFLLLIRLYWGLAFTVVGAMKLGNIHGTATMLQTLSFPAPVFFAYVAALVEFIGGICLFLGLISRLAGLILAIQMIVALLTAHYAATMSIFTNLHTFVTQSPVTFLLVTLTIFCFGAGPFSLDYFISKRINKPPTRGYSSRS